MEETEIDPRASGGERPREKPWWAWPGSRKDRLEYVGIIAGIVLAIAGGIVVPLVLFEASHSASTTPPTAPTPAPITSAPITTPPAQTVNLGMTATGYDGAYGRKWGTALDVDNHDPLKLRFTITNRDAKPTPHLVLYLLYQNSYPSYFVVGVIPEGGSGQVSLGPQLRLNVWSGLGAFAIDSSEVIDAHGKPLRKLEVPLNPTNATYPTNLDATGSYDLGVVAPHATVRVGFAGTFLYPNSSGLSGGGGTVEFRHLKASRHSYTSTGSAEPGDRLRFSVQLNNTGFGPSTFQLHVRITPSHRAPFLKVAVSDDEVYKGKHWVIGSAIVNARDKPISPRIIPGTTTLWSVSSRCSKEREVAKLPEGLAEGGLAVSVGGFRPHDPCHGAEFARWLVFDVAVH
jgi:hypothetical protein